MTKPKSTSPALHRAFVDAIEGPNARLLLGEVVVPYPAALLPKGAREGSWIEIGVRVILPPDDDGTDRRTRLGANDPGGDIKL